MESFIIAGARALRSLFAPGMFGLFVLTVLVTIAALIGFVVTASSFFAWLSGTMQGSEWAPWLPWFGGIGATVVAWLLFPGIMPVIATFFDNRIAQTIEQQEYAAVRPHEPAFWPELVHDMRFTALAITLNVLVLPLYLLPVINLVLFYALNGYLLGREFFTMAARRHLPGIEVEKLRRRHGRSVMAAGVMLTFLATIPIANLIAPFWGIAVMVHLYHRFAATPRAQLLPAS